MASVKGQSAVRQHLRAMPQALVQKVLRGAARAGAKIVADEARARSISAEVASAVKVSTRIEEDRIVAMVQVKGKYAFLAPWLEYGTAPHFISVDPSQSGGMGIQRINQTDRKAREDGLIGSKESLIIKGKFVGQTVLHPGARAHPFLRPALDAKEADAFRAAQAFISVRVGPVGASGDDAGDAA